MTENKKAKKIYISMVVLGYIVMVVPVLVYNAVNYQIFEQVSATKLTFTFLIALSMIAIALLTKMKQRTGWYMLLAGIVLAVIGEASTQIGYSLLMIGGSMTLDNLVLKKIALHFKEIWYESIGKQVIHTRNFDV